MTTTDPDPSDPILDTPAPIRITSEPPKIRWWTTVSAAILGVAIAVSLVVGVVGQWQSARSDKRGLQSERENAAFARSVATKDQAEADCIRQRNGNLTVSASDQVDLTTELFIRLAQRDPELSNPANPVYARFQQLRDQRGAARAAVVNAVEECRQS